MTSRACLTGKSAAGNASSRISSKRLTYKTGKQLVLKSPPHTGRVKVLKDMFPEAKFIHIVRDPYVVFASTINMWKAMYKSHGLQRPTYEGLEEQVFQNYLRLHARLEEAKAILEPRQYFSLKYEDLIRDPEGQCGAVYDHFQMSGFDEYLPRLCALPRRAAPAMKPTVISSTSVIAAEINRRWGKIIAQYGYARPDGVDIVDG